MTLDPTDAEIEATLADRANWPLAARAVMLWDTDSSNRGNLAILVASLRKQAARIAELEATIARLTDFAPAESVGVPSHVVRIEPLPAPSEAVVATPLNKITTFPRNSPSDGVDEQ